jgi:ankyrin repeat protein
MTQERINRKLFDGTIHSNVSLMREMITKGADVNVFLRDDRIWCTPLFISIKQKNLETARILMKNGAVANRDYKDENGKMWNIMTYAMSNSSMEICELAVEFKCFDVREVIHYASHHCSVEMLELILTKGGGEAYIDHVSEKWKRTPLYFAKTVEHSRLLIRHGANVNHSVDNESILHNACSTSRFEFVKVLVEHGADVNFQMSADAPRWSLCTPLQFAASTGCVEIVEYLVEQGARIDIVDASGHDAEHYARVRNHIRAAEFLSQHRAFIDGDIATDSDEDDDDDLPWSRMYCVMGCSNKTKYRCKGCYSIKYCSVTCQHKDWKDHRRDCKKIRAYIECEKQQVAATRAPPPTNSS